LWTEEEPGWDERRVLVVEPAHLRALGTAAAMEGYLWIALDPPRPLHRGKLALHIEECIESALQARGAPPPGVGASADLDASLGDQLYRARLVEMRGVALGVPDLGGIANLGGVLDAEDSAALRWWAAAAMDRPVRVVLSAENQAYRIYPSPVPFGVLLEGQRGAFTDAPSPRAPSAETAQSVAAMELSDLPPAVTEVEPEEAARRLAADVDLPELDRALGLEPEAPASEPREAMDLAPAADLPSEAVEAAPEAPPAVECDAAEVADEPSPATAHEDEPRDVVVSASEPSQGIEPPAAAASAAEPDASPEPVSTAECATTPESVDTAEPVHSAESVEPAEPVEPAEAAHGAHVVEPGEATRGAQGPAEEPDDAVLAALSSPAAPPVSPAARPVSARPVSAGPVSARPVSARPLIKSSISLGAARQSAVRRTPFVVSADDADAFEVLSEPSRPAPTDDAPVARETAQADPVPSSPAIASAPAPANVTPEAAGEEDPFEAYAREHWKTWVRELDAARGPKPLALVERLFVTSYTRLDAALERGIADESARGALDSWRASFSKSYSEAFDALRVRGKRPNMVLDVPELAQRVGRLHGARRVQLLLVDGMRFDLGMMVQDRLKLRGDASLTERMLLWSALPTTTTQQLELLGRGPDGLKDMTPIEEEAPAVVARGRAAHTLRRIRTGRRELFKLDIVEAALREGPAEGDLRTLRERLPSIADDVAAAVADYFTKQAPRTLVVVFGDHGFRCHDEAPLGQEASQGGSSPEEVLVPAFAWLTGATH
jgi:hypothetical protein